MTPREQRLIRKEWKKRSDAHRSRCTALKIATRTFMRNTTPSDSDTEVSENVRSSEPPPSVAVTPRVITARKKCEKLRKLRNNQIKKKDEQIKALKKKLERYRKRLIRSKVRQPLTPNTKVQKMLDTPSSRDTVTKTLLFGEIMKEQIAQNYNQLKLRKERTVFSRVLTGKHVRKYKLLEEVGLSKKRLVTATKAQSFLDLHRKVRSDKISEETKAAVIKFLEDESNTKMCAGKKECITRNKERKQKQFLLDTMGNLHKKFVSSTAIALTYSYFCKCRPFWILQPRVADRDTCRCIMHSNFNYLLEVLNRANIISIGSHQKVLEYLCCDRYNEECLSRNCRECKLKTIKYEEFNNSTNLNLKQWVSTSEEIIDSKNKASRKVKKYAKSIFSLTPRKIILMLEDKLDGFFKS